MVGDPPDWCAAPAPPAPGPCSAPGPEAAGGEGEDWPPPSPPDRPLPSRLRPCRRRARRGWPSDGRGQGTRCRGNTLGRECHTFEHRGEKEETS